jgi:hypothetical protein
LGPRDAGLAAIAGRSSQRAHTTRAALSRNSACDLAVARAGAQ